MKEEEKIKLFYGHACSMREILCIHVAVAHNICTLYECDIS